ncbi:hypothetical protein [Microbacterium sp. A84]|uniref:hypothetical protein n=1 Tax=Microbacterium sp. A84 TaxID=3450715 RepID=UPI003F430E51
MKRRTIWIVAAAAAAVVALAALVWFLLPRGSSAEDQALAYFHALADGDLEAVQASGVETSEQAASAFLAASAHLSEATVESSAEDESSTLVTVSYVLGDEQFTAELSMINQAGRWVPEAASALGAVQFNVPVSIGDAALTADSAVSLLPAEYAVVAVPAAFLDAHAALQILPGSSQEIELHAALRPEATELAQAQLDDYLKICTATAAHVPASCGMVIPWAADFSAVSEISYRIDHTPTIALTPTSFHADGGALVATVTGTALDGSAKSLTYRTLTWALRGDVTFTADDIVLSVW